MAACGNSDSDSGTSRCGADVLRGAGDPRRLPRRRGRDHGRRASPPRRRPPRPPTTESAPATTAPTAGGGGDAKLAVGDGQAKDSLDPALVITSIPVLGGGMIYDTLLYVTCSGQLTPMLAEDWSVQPGRQGVDVQAPPGRRVPHRQDPRGGRRRRAVQARARREGRLARPRHPLAGARPLGHHRRRPDHDHLQAEESPTASSGSRPRTTPRASRRPAPPTGSRARSAPARSRTSPSARARASSSSATRTTGRTASRCSTPSPASSSPSRPRRRRPCSTATPTSPTRRPWRRSRSSRARLRHVPQGRPLAVHVRRRHLHHAVLRPARSARR